MTLYRKLPVEIEAFRLERLTRDNWPAWFRDALDHGQCVESEPGIVQVRTTEGVMTAMAGDWIIKGVEGELYPCKDTVFTQTYEAVR